MKFSGFTKSFRQYYFGIDIKTQYYTKQKKACIGLIVAVPCFITHDILIKKKWFYCMKSRFPSLLFYEAASFHYGPSYIRRLIFLKTMFGTYALWKIKKAFTFRQMFQIVFINFQKSTTYGSVVRFEKFCSQRYY